MKKIVWGIIALVVLGIVGLIGYIKWALPNVGAAPDLKIEATTELLERGKYLANNVCVCMDCHSTRDWNKFAGPLVPGTLGVGGEAFTEKYGFPGNFYSANISPAALGSWTDGEIYRAITCGVSKDGHAFFPVMPYHNYGQMDPEDIKSIIAYIRTLTPIVHQVPKSEPTFPMNILLNTIPKKGEGAKIPSKEQVLDYGKYMINAAACAECHTKKDKGEKVKGMDYAGGFEFPLPTGTVVSTNITPHETGLKRWTKQAFINRFKAYADSNYKDVDIAGGFQTVMPWKMYAGMTEEDLGAIFDYLQTVTPVENKPVRFKKN